MHYGKPIAGHLPSAYWVDECPENQHICDNHVFRGHEALGVSHIQGYSTAAYTPPPTPWYKDGDAALAAIQWGIALAILTATLLGALIAIGGSLIHFYDRFVDEGLDDGDDEDV